MRNVLFLFNPDHDLALANHDANYMSPASARQFSTDLALFPVWYAGEHSLVLAASAYNLNFLNTIRRQFPGLASLLTETEVATTKGLEFEPWGWDSAVYKRFIQLGVAPRDLPVQERLNTIREKSHRLQAIRMLNRLQFDHCCGESFYMTDLNELRTFVESRRTCLLKAPLSGSGKGLNWCKGVFTSHINDWCKNVIRQQGGVVGEPVYDKRLDFAMQFYADAEGSVRFAGYSLFSTTGSGAYEGNLLIPDEEIEAYITQFIPQETLDRVCHTLEEELSVLIDGIYVGYLGVDMMVCRFSDLFDLRLHPCVEINLRMTMGMVSHILYERYVQPGKKGVFKVNYHATNEQLQEENQRMLAEYPLQVEHGRVTKGYLSLVPVTPRARYSAWLLVDESITI